MGKFYQFKVADQYLYYTSHDVIECFHVHASNSNKLLEKGSAKFWVNQYGNATVADPGRLSKIQINKIIKFIKENYLEMFEIWKKANLKAEFKNK